MRKTLGSANRYSALLLTFCGVVFISASAFGAGGACPTGANYINTTTNSQVTLASLGVTNCYYVSAAGSDSNAGTSEAAPWLHAPGMPSCSGNCATQWNGTIPAGAGIILRGGDTWHFGNSSASPYSGGVWNFSVNPYPMGTSANPIYVGVDQAWYTGASWTRPILNGDNPTSTSTTLSSCPYQIGSQNTFFEMQGLQYYILDNFEMTGLCQSDVGQPSHHDVYVSYGGLRAPMTFENLYIHGWTHVQFAALNGSTGCTASSVCFNIFAFNGSVTGTTTGETVQGVVVDGSDSDPVGAGLAFGGFYNVAHSVFRYTSQCVVSHLHAFHDNLYEYFFENGHSNLLEALNETPGSNAVYNNLFRHIENNCASGCGVGFWPAPPVGATDYYFNNLIYDAGAIEYFNIGQNGNSQGALIFFNNTWEWALTAPPFTCTTTSAPFTVANNLYILDGATPYGPNCASQQTTVTNLQMTHATATSKGFTASETYAYSPTSSSSPTVGAGTNEGTQNSAYCSALSTAASSDPYLSDAASACYNDTRYGCTYNSTSHMVNCPARSIIARPTNAAPDIGAYQFGSSPTPQPPTNVQAAAH